MTDVGGEGDMVCGLGCREEGERVIWSGVMVLDGYVNSELH